MVDEFEVEPVFEYRQHERHQFKLVIDGRKYKGDYQDGKIQWINPHPKQVVSESELRAVEAEVFELLGAHGVRDETEHIEIEPMPRCESRQIHVFKMKINGEEYKGTFRKEKIQWCHPKPRRKIKAERVEKVEEKVREKIKEKFE